MARSATGRRWARGTFTGRTACRTAGCSRATSSRIPERRSSGWRTHAYTSGRHVWRQVPRRDQVGRALRERRRLKPLSLSLNVPMKPRKFHVLEPGSDEVTVECDMHTDEFLPLGWYDKAKRLLGSFRERLSEEGRRRDAGDTGQLRRLDSRARR